MKKFSVTKKTAETSPMPRKPITPTMPAPAAERCTASALRLMVSKNPVSLVGCFSAIWRFFLSCGFGFRLCLLFGEALFHVADPRFVDGAVDDRGPHGERQRDRR